MIISAMAALVAAGDVLPEIDRAYLDRQARVEARRGTTAPAVPSARGVVVGARAARTEPRGRASGRNSETPAATRAALELAVVGM